MIDIAYSSDNLSYYENNQSDMLSDDEYDSDEDEAPKILQVPAFFQKCRPTIPRCYDASGDASCMLRASSTVDRCCSLYALSSAGLYKTEHALSVA
eukprot:scaffold275_cov59-Attheya_sp.AAC.1